MKKGGIIVLTSSADVLFTRSEISVGSSDVAIVVMFAGVGDMPLTGALLAGPPCEAGALLGGPCEAGALLGGPCDMGALLGGPPGAMLLPGPAGSIGALLAGPLVGPP